MAIFKPTFPAVLLGAVILFAIPNEANAQIGSRLGGLFQLGNGRGARIGGPRIGVQFGGGQGTQFGRLSPTASRAPVIYYNGFPRRQYRPVASAAGSISQQPVYQPAAGGQPRIARPQTVRAVSPQSHTLKPLTNRYRPPTGTLAGGSISAANYPTVESPRLDSQVRPAAAVGTLRGQFDIARQPTVEPAISSPVEPATSIDGKVRLRFPEHEDAPFSFRLNGEQFAIEKGQVVTLSRSDEYKIRFSGGAGLGDRIATLEAGKSYAFDLRHKEGWVLIPDVPSAPVSTAVPQPPPGTAIVDQSPVSKEKADLRGLTEPEKGDASEDMIVPAESVSDVDPGAISSTDLTGASSETDNVSKPSIESEADNRVENSILKFDN